MTRDEKLKVVADVLRAWESGDAACPEDAGLPNSLVAPHVDCDGTVSGGKCPLCFATAIADFLGDIEASVPEHGKTVEQRIFSEFTNKFKKLTSEILGEVETDFLPHIETDLVLNERDEVINALTSKWNNPNAERFVIGSYEAREIRARIFEENRDTIITELDQDNLKKIAELEQTIKIMQDAEDFRRRLSCGC
jgi:hypothetical protein